MDSASLTPSSPATLYGSPVIPTTEDEPASDKFTQPAGDDFAEPADDKFREQTEEVAKLRAETVKLRKANKELIEAYTLLWNEAENLEKRMANGKALSEKLHNHHLEVQRQLDAALEVLRTKNRILEDEVDEHRQNNLMDGMFKQLQSSVKLEEMETQNRQLLEKVEELEFKIKMMEQSEEMTTSET